jgi:sec-independent protein translocase protein TatC
VAYFGVFPFVLPYLAQFVPEDVNVQLRMNETISMIVLGLLGFGIAFQFPMVVLILVYMGVLTPDTLRQYRKLVIVGLAVVSAMLTPPDPVSMCLMLVPLYLLYEGSIWVSYLVIRSQKKASAQGA